VVVAAVAVTALRARFLRSVAFPVVLAVGSIVVIPRIAHGFAPFLVFRPRAPR
jgi:hypothetical protein